jgi:hypothetical protein
VKLLHDAGEPDFASLGEREHAHIDRLTAVRFEDPEPIEIIGEEQPAEPAESADGPVVAAPEKPQPCADFAFTPDCSPARDLIWEDFGPAKPGALDPGDAQVNPRLITRDKVKKFSARLGGEIRVETGKKTQSLLEHERIHWKITCRIVQLANDEVARGSDFAAVFRVANEVHRFINDHQTGLYDTDTGHGVSDAIPKFDWPKEWCIVVEERWEKTAKDREIRTIKIKPLSLSG